MTRARIPPWLLATYPLIALTACPGPSSEPDTDTDEPVRAGICDEPRDVDCVDDLVLDLGLQDDAFSDGSVTTTVDGSDFVTEVDATAGGVSNAATNPWVYVRFTSNGAEKVEIDDETALGSTEWHVAARRFILRVNSGSSGPSCVAASPVFDRTYAELDAPAEGVTWYEDDFYTPDCTLINDSSGLPDNPQVALAPWWEYPGCVATSMTPFFLRLETGEVVKLVVEEYYAEGQEDCNTNGTMGSGSANFTWRWTFVQ